MRQCPSARCATRAPRPIPRKTRLDDGAGDIFPDQVGVPQAAAHGGTKPQDVGSHHTTSWRPMSWRPGLTVSCVAGSPCGRFSTESFERNARTALQGADARR